MKQLKREDLKNLSPNQVLDALNTGAQIVNVGFPFIKDLFGKIGELVKTFQTDKLSTPHGKRVAIEELQKHVEVLEAQNQLQKKFNSQLLDVLAAHGINISDVDAENSSDTGAQA